MKEYAGEPSNSLFDVRNAMASRDVLRERVKHESLIRWPFFQSYDSALSVYRERLSAWLPFEWIQKQKNRLSSCSAFLENSKTKEQCFSSSVQTEVLLVQKLNKVLGSIYALRKHK